MRPAASEICARLKRDLVSFRFLSETDAAAIAPFFNCRQARAGEILWREGEGCDSLAIIIDGRVDIKKATEFEGKEVIVGVYGRGSVVGELCFLDQAPREVTVVALEDTNLLLLTRDSFDRLLEEQPTAAIRLLQGMLLAVSSRLRSCFDRLASIF